MTIIYYVCAVNTTDVYGTTSRDKFLSTVTTTTAADQCSHVPRTRQNVFFFNCYRTRARGRRAVRMHRRTHVLYRRFFYFILPTSNSDERLLKAYRFKTKRVWNSFAIKINSKSLVEKKNNCNSNGNLNGFFPRNTSIMSVPNVVSLKGFAKFEKIVTKKLKYNNGISTLGFLNHVVFKYLKTQLMTGSGGSVEGGDGWIAPP